MLSIVSIIVGVLGLALIGFMARRDHAAQLEKRRDLLDQSAGLLERSSLNHGSDGFPKLEGRHRGRYIRAEFIPDTMTIKRLPQLWLSLSRIEPQPGNSEFAILVRPSGTEFYSLTTGYEHRLEPPAGLPDEILVRGSRPSAQQHLNRVGPIIGKILTDPKVKEDRRYEKRPAPCLASQRRSPWRAPDFAPVRIRRRARDASGLCETSRISR